ncbi:hypothetical protein [Abyssisolibacter fermentans]|uniref:hypothetical protein n=1 Tax=Abyssisolibacter fermentans TaxID=1766203 RepID=UPI00082E096F|nr:hypothetical protein [Abyssisolibacter fermentans]
MQVAFWSVVHGQASTTSNMIAVSLMTALEYRMKLLITHNHFEKSTLESSLINRRYLKKGLTDLEDTGIDALSRFVKFNNIDKDSIVNYTTTLLKNRLDLLIGTSNTNRELYFNNLGKIIQTIFNSAQEYYDILFIDVCSGYNELSRKIVDESDLVVVNLNQNINVLDDFFQNHKDLLDKCVVLISMYDDNSRFNYKMISRKYGLKKGIGLIPYCREFGDACNEGKAVDFFMRNLRANKDDSNYYFIKEVRKSVQMILEKIDIDISLKKIGD